LLARYCYTLLFYLITPLILLRLSYRAIKASAYRQRIAERFGLFTAPKMQSCIWLHSVSVGETIAAAPIVKRLQQQHPNTPIVVTTMTPTGSERVRALFGDSVFHVYAPYDLPGSINRFLDKIQPRLLVIMETELWPNTLHYCHKKNIPVVLANGRLSEKSAAGYQRLSALSKPMLGKLSRVVAQTQADGDRFQALGLPASKVEVSGSIKFDIDPGVELRKEAAALKSLWSQDGQRLIVLAASTHQGEDEIILQAFQQVLERQPSLLLVLVPRHPERFGSVSKMAVDSGLSTERRSIVNSPAVSTQVFIGDTMGELLLFYGCADIAFIGGSLVNTGGHNMLEAASWALPIITGASDFNFLEISRLLQQREGLAKVEDVQGLADQIESWASSKTLRAKAGANALAVVEANRGALERLLRALNQYL
jgi:3-deoxy-D-manno-octulosonic-acid transferase